MDEYIGWGSAAILLITLLMQIKAQWQSKSDGGVSPWLFIGQLFTSAGFITYSALKHDAVFIVTNSMIAAVAVVGELMYLHLQRGRHPRHASGAAHARRKSAVR